MKLCAMVLLAAAAMPCSQAVAQYRDGRPFERNPIYPTPILIEGRLALSYVEDPVADAVSEARGVSHAHLRSPTRSFLRIGGTETLDGGLLAHFRLEHSFQPANGRPLDGEGRFWDAQASVGLSLRRGGRFDLGRQEQPAWGIALRLDPWGGNSVASPDRWLYAPAAAASASMPYGNDRRAGGLVVTLPWDSPARPAVVFEFLAAPRAAGEPGAASPRGGASLRYERGEWFVGAGWQQWRDGSRSAPFGVRRDFGAWALSAAHTRGRQQTDTAGNAAEFHTTMLGASWLFMGKGHPRRHEVLAALSGYSSGGAERQWKLGAGYRYRLGPRTSLQVNTALARTVDPGNARPSSHWLFDVGLVHLFARDLRVPQEPR